MEEPLVEIFKQSFQVVGTALSGVETLASAHLAHQVGLPADMMAGNILAITGRGLAVNRPAVHLGQQDVGNGFQHGRGVFFFFSTQRLAAHRSGDRSAARYRPEPDFRLKLYVGFARARLAALEQARSDPKTTDRGLATHDRLQVFLDVYDELNDNIDTYVERKSDLRKALKAVIEGDTEFQAKLRALRDDATAKKEETGQYEFLLSNALDTLDSSVQDHRQLLTEQEEARRKKPAKR